VSRLGRSLPQAIGEFVLDSADAWSARKLGGLIQEWRESLIFPVFRHGRLIVIEQELDEERAEQVPAGVTIERRSEDDDWTDFSEVANRRMIARMKRAAHRGRNCLIARRDEAIIGYTWISDHVDPDLELFPIPLPGNAAYGWNLYVAPPERSTGVGSALVAARLNFARKRGFRSMWRAIDVGNVATVRTVQKTWGRGSRLVGEMAYMRLFGWAHGRLSPADAAVVMSSRDR
jgi:GNAT superfamily N-acetyltransferase